MENILQPASVPERILVVRLGSMGDIVHTLPAVAALRCALPGAHIGWAIEERWSELLCGRGTPLAGPTSPTRPLVDSVHVVNTHRWRKALFVHETRREALRAISEIRDPHYQVAIDLQGAMKSALVAQFSGAPVRLGFAHPRESAARLFYTRAIATEHKHIVEQNTELAKAVVMRLPTLSVQKQDGQAWGTHSQFPLPQDPAAETWCDNQFRGREFAIVNPGAGWGAKCWPLERYAEVAHALSAEGLQVLVNIGPKEEQLGRGTESANIRPIVCSVGQLIALCRRARLMVGGDTGPLHLAAALRVPVIGIYGPTDPARNGPVGSRSRVLRNPASQTSLRHRSDPDPGLLAITAAEVIAAARHVLGGTA